MSHTTKIVADGIYARLYGWTVISKVENDLKFIENFITHNNILSPYFLAMPSSSYNIRLYNLWSNLQSLLPEQQEAINNEHYSDTKEELEIQARSIGWFNPKNCLQKVFTNIDNVCRENKYDKICVTIDRVVFSGGMIFLSLKNSPEIDKIDMVRNKILEFYEKDDIMSYMIPLAHIYKDIPKKIEEKISYQVNVLNALLSNQTITLSEPGLYSFSSMKTYQKYNSTDFSRY